ncbi:phospholipase A2 inhibitor and Ly6/PLAUR domain-containing protein-like [Anomaloglossus baeobatrachus]|uniref:phospholipase A2 inhibitor and Ly6/PLAUR domain-containing protein-like n=1 Tax=Anomaloglossus baeobatrachus TaxID=238106 RepID=UPI003F4FD31A
MKNLVALLCLISASIGSVFSHKCYSCWSRNSTICKEIEIDCLGADCMTASQTVKLYGKEHYAMFKGCSNETLCGAEGSGVVDQVEFKFLAHCCIGDLCNKQGYDPPKNNLTKNGVKCPFSICPGSLEECKSDKEINCTGSMDRCMDYRATVRDEDGIDANYSGKGCTNRDSCKYNFDSKIMFKEMHRVLLNC